MRNAEDIKKIVQNKYAKIAIESEKSNQLSCCEPSASSCCKKSDSDYSSFNDDYNTLSGYVPEADLNLGCGLPTQFAGIKEGDTVVDLGSGAGNDVFVARSLVSESGTVIGIDMTQEMIDKAQKNNNRLGFNNVEFRLGEIESLPVESETVDVVISNCVLNLVPDKQKAFQEIFRILKPGAHFCVSDIVLHGQLTDTLRKSAALYAGCISGGLQEDEYIQIIKDSGFINIDIKIRKNIILPDSLLEEYVTENDLNYLQNNNIGIFSITVVAFKE
jgi:SAM-dependent methyltransferase